MGIKNLRKRGEVKILVLVYVVVFDSLDTFSLYKTG